MKKMHKNRSGKMRRTALLIIGFVIIAFGIIVVLESTNTINLYRRGTSSPHAQPQVQGEDSIDYSPATTTDNEDINAKKASGEIELSPNTPTADTDIQITFIANAQDYSGGQLEIRTLLSGVTDGTCTLTLTKGSTSIQKQTGVTQQNNTFQCEAFIVPYSELANGGWQIKLRVTSGDGRTNEATTSTTIN